MGNGDPQRAESASLLLSARRGRGKRTPSCGKGSPIATQHGVVRPTGHTPGRVTPSRRRGSPRLRTQGRSKRRHRAEAAVEGLAEGGLLRALRLDTRGLVLRQARVLSCHLGRGGRGNAFVEVGLLFWLGW